MLSQTSPETARRCKTCGILKTLDLYYKYRKTYRNRECKVCYDKRKEKNIALNPKKYINANLERKYGLTLLEYNQMLIAQDFKCSICGKDITEQKRRMCVDHDHETGQIRGLLCSNCNKSLGGFEDDIDILCSAISYLKNSRLKAVS